MIWEKVLIKSVQSNSFTQSIGNKIDVYALMLEGFRSSKRNAVYIAMQCHAKWNNGKKQIERDPGVIGAPSNSWFIKREENLRRNIF